MLARALAASVGCTFKRIQCTPDLLPTDVTGASVFNQKTTEFEFRPGPIFAQIVLADEINRTTPRTQAALLEAMAEGRVTVDGVTHALAAAVPGHRHAEPDRPRRHVPAARGPTRPLPDAVQPGLSEPGRGAEDARTCCSTGIRSTSLQPVVTAEELVACQQAVREVHVDDKVRPLHDADRPRHARARGPEPGRQPAGVDRPVPHVARRWPPSAAATSSSPTT